MLCKPYTREEEGNWKVIQESSYLKLLQHENTGVLHPFRIILARSSFVLAQAPSYDEISRDWSCLTEFLSSLSGSMVQEPLWLLSQVDNFYKKQAQALAAISAPVFTQVPMVFEDYDTSTRFRQEQNQQLVEKLLESVPPWPNLDITQQTSEPTPNTPEPRSSPESSTIKSPTEHKSISWNKITKPTPSPPESVLPTIGSRDRDSSPMLSKQVQSPRGSTYVVDDSESLPAEDYYKILEFATNADLLVTFLARYQLREIRAILLFRDDHQQTPLHLASSAGNLECVKILIERGISVNAQDKNGWNALHCAATAGHFEVCSFLIRSGACQLALTNSHAIPLHYLVRLPIEKDDPIEPEFVKLIKSMIAEGADVNARDIAGRTPLASVCTRGRNINCVQTLLELNATVNNLDYNNFTCLHLAVLDKNHSLVQVLLKHDADPTIGTITPLQEAQRINDSVTEELIEKHLREREPSTTPDHIGVSRSLSGHKLPAAPSMSSANLPAAAKDKFANPRSSSDILIDRSHRSRSLSLNTANSTNSLPVREPKIKRTPTLSITPVAATASVPVFTAPPVVGESSSSVDSKKRTFGIPDEDQRFIETLNCEYSGKSGLLYIWQYYVAFESMRGDARIVIPIRHVDSLAKKNHSFRVGVELIVKNAKHFFHSFVGRVSPVEVFNVLKFLLQIRNYPTPVKIKGVPFYLLLGKARFPDIHKELKRRFEAVLPVQETLVDFFDCSIYSPSSAQLAAPSGKGRIYLTQRFIAFYANNFSQKVTILMHLKNVFSVSEHKSNAVEILHRSRHSDTHESRFFVFPDPETRSRALATITLQWQVEIQNATLPTIAIIGSDTLLGHHVLQFLEYPGKVRAILIQSNCKIDSTLASMNSELGSMKYANITCEHVSVDLYNESELENALRGVTRVLFIPSLENLVGQTQRVLGVLDRFALETPIHLVFVTLLHQSSFAHGTYSILDWHSQAVELIKEAKVSYTLFRISLPMQFLKFCCVGDGDEIFPLPIGKSKISWLDLRDVVSPIGNVLMNKSFPGTTQNSGTLNANPNSILTSYLNQTFNLTGPELISAERIEQFLDTLLEKSGMKICQDPALFSTLLHRSGDLDSNFISPVVNLFEAARDNQFDLLTNNVSQLFGIDSLRSLEGFFQEHSSWFTEVYKMYFTPKERSFLETAFRELAEGRSEMDRATFMKNAGSFFSSSGLVYALFRAFDFKREERINLAKFLNGFSILLRGSVEEQIHFASRMFDSGRTGFLTSRDITLIFDAIRLLLRNEPNRGLEFGREIKSLFKSDDSVGLSVSQFTQIAMQNYGFISSFGRIPLHSINARYQEEINSPAKLGYPIVIGHDQWDLVWHIMCGITTSVKTGSLHQTTFRNLEKEFEAEEEYKFDLNPTPAKDAAAGIVNSWAFKDIAPGIFKRIRESFGVSSDEYLDALGTERFLGNLFLGKLTPFRTIYSTGRSGSVFFTSNDGKFYVKTIPEEEDVVFRRILRSYFYYISEYPSTLITRFFGLHRIRFGNGPWMSFVVMANLFAGSDLTIHEIYDLKGSTVNRHVEVKPSEDRSAVALKDNDFRRTLKLGRAKPVFLEQIERDVRWMESHNICDYSLLVGLHLPEYEEGAPAKFEEEKSLDELIGDKAPYKQHGTLLFKHFKRGILSADKSEVYFIGIIDTLTEYNYKKKGELLAKSLIHHPDGISAASPTRYRKRYLKYVTHIIE